MDTITRREFTERLVALCVRSGLRAAPRKARDRHILLKGIALSLDLKAEYTEEEMNESLKSWLNEVGGTLRRFGHVRLRRLLIDEEYLGRSKDGSRYWVALGSRHHPTFEPGVQEVDVLGAIRLDREEQENRKQMYMQRGASSRALRDVPTPPNTLSSAAPLNTKE